MPPLLQSKFSVTQHSIPRLILAWLVSRMWQIQSVLRRRKGRKDYSDRPLEQRLRDREAQLRSFLRRYPWWSKGHLLLGMTELDLSGQLADRAAMFRALSAARLSAEAVIQIEGTPHAVAGTRVEGTVLAARAIQGLVLARHQKFPDALAILKHVLALNNAHRLPENVRNAALEAAGASAYLTGDGGLALEFLSRVPLDSLSQEGRATLNALRGAALGL